MKLKIYADGACRGNPGPSGCGFLIYDAENNLLKEGAVPIGRATNNVAEYSALMYAVKAMQEYKPSEVDIFMDSELVVKQMKGEYKVRKPELQAIKSQIEPFLSGIKVTFTHIPRKLNAEADKLANQSLDD